MFNLLAGISLFENSRETDAMEPVLADAASVFGGRDNTAEVLEILPSARVLVVGAGGLGNQILKCLASCRVGTIDVVDLDTLELSNLNRQILFRDSDVGRYKAEAVADRVAELFGVQITPHACKIQDCPPSFFRQFTCVIAGVDNIEARRWLNQMLCSLVEFDVDGRPVASSIIPLIDGGTEGFLGHCRIIFPFCTPCFECTLLSFPPQETFPLCTIVDKPRLPEHCIEYALIVSWAKERAQETPDFDNQEHVDWLFVRATERAAQFGIEGVTRSRVLGVVKKITPAVASTNQVIGALSTHEAIKCITGVYQLSCNYTLYNGLQGNTFTSLNLEANPDCVCCSKARRCA